MADLVFGAGTSHSPMLILDADGWRAWAATRDTTMTDLADGDGIVRPYDDWTARNGDRLAAELTDNAVADKVRRRTAALHELRDRLTDADLDTLIIIGDDQGEHLGPNNLPPILIHHGDHLTNTPSPLGDDTPILMRTVMDGYFEPDTERAYPVDVALAEHLVDRLLDAGFDIATSNELPAARPEGHAFQFVHRHLTPPGLATVAVLLNTYMSPAQPRARRCVQLGAAIAEAVAAMNGPRRVGILASGGLSHFLVSEDLDLHVLDACAKHDTDTLAAIPEPVLRSGTSEIKNWITVAGASSHLQFDLIDYIAAYRTPAGTGTGLAFATWEVP
jgi:Catalytic LigB subunit of aromatic ring-opening dioxygenase